MKATELQRAKNPDLIASVTAIKVDAPHPDSLADELAAMANANGGTLL